MRIRLDHTEDVARNIKTFWFEPEKSVDYVAGQYVEMFLPHDGADQRGQKHWFTLSSSPTEKLISITTKHSTERVSTFKQVLFGMEVGEAISISEPVGDFVLPKDVNIPLVFIAGGIGVTPIRSIVKWLTDTSEKRELQIIYGVQSLEEVAFRDLFEAYGAKLDIILSEPSADWSGLTGHLSSGLILELAGHNPNQLIYVSGPEPLTEKLEANLLKADVPKEKLVLDFFPNYTAI